MAMRNPLQERAAEASLFSSSWLATSSLALFVSKRM
jgi:hypothetical protein